VNSIGCLVDGECWIRWDSVVRIHIFSDHLVSEGALQSYVFYCHHKICLLRSMVKSEMENDLEAEF
jgi:hypothetical protein